jgi:hypothetical protein
MKQSFLVRGLRVLPRSAPPAEVEDAMTDLRTTLKAWLWISPVVTMWRVSPTFSIEHDFAKDVVVVTVYARGWFDRAGESLLIGLP